MIAYFYCLCGRRKQQAKSLQDEGFTVVVTKGDAIATRVAKSYGLRLPIKVVHDVAERI